MDETLRQVFGDVFGLKPEEVRDELRAEDVEAWDSVMHLTLQLSLEQAFGVSFDPQESQELRSVGAIKDALRRKLAAKPGAAQ